MHITCLLKSISSQLKWLVLIGVFSILSACGSSSETPDTRTIDTEPPVITLNGEPDITIDQGHEYNDPGVSATDLVDGDVTVIISGNVDINTVGTYEITYAATDAAGNTAKIIRTVNVIEVIPFITTWKTHNPGLSDDNQITITTATDDQNFIIDWGDGSQDIGVSGDITHTYANPGTYTISIGGDFRNIQFKPGTYSDNQKLLSIEQWGDVQWSTMQAAFFGCSNLVLKAIDQPNLTSVTNMEYMFSGASAFNGDLNQWNVSTVTNMDFMFAEASAFNGDISGWDVSSVMKMRGMFYRASAFNGDLSQWDVSSVWNMQGMFNFAVAFNGDISGWIVSSVSDMSFMFSMASAFNGDISRWDVSGVRDMRTMFYGAAAFNGNISLWDISSVQDMRDMFIDVTLSTQVYDAILQGWSSRVLQEDVVFDGGNSQYSSAAQTARDALVNTYGWTIRDGGLEPAAP